jgi:uncharacterized protein
MIYFKKILYLILAIGFSSANAGSYEDFFGAVSSGDSRSIRQLLERGFDPNARDPKGQTALHLALRDQVPAVVEALLASPVIDVDAVNAHGETPLMMAALKGELEWVRKLLARGAKVDKPGWAPLHYAATGPEPQIVALLLDRGASIEAESPNRSTPLMMASQYGTEASVDLLLARGADARRRNDLGLDATEFARRSGRDFLVEKLKRAQTR